MLIGAGEALVVAEVEVGLGAVVGDEDLAVLERAHRARIDVDVGTGDEDVFGHGAVPPGKRDDNRCTREPRQQSGCPPRDRSGHAARRSRSSTDSIAMSIVGARCGFGEELLVASSGGTAARFAPGIQHAPSVSAPSGALRSAALASSRASGG